MSCSQTYSASWQDPYEGIEDTAFDNSPFAELPAHPTGDPATWATTASNQLAVIASGNGWTPEVTIGTTGVAAGSSANCNGTSSDGIGTIAVPANPDNLSSLLGLSASFLPSSGGTSSTYSEFRPEIPDCCTKTYTAVGETATLGSWTAGSYLVTGTTPEAIYTYTPADYAIEASTPDEPGERLNYTLEGVAPEQVDGLDAPDIDYTNINPSAITSRTFSGAIAAPTIGTVSWSPGANALSEPPVSLPDWIGSVTHINAPTLARPQWANVVQSRSIDIPATEIPVPEWNFDDPDAWTDFIEYLDASTPWASEVLERLRVKLEAIRNGEFSIGTDIWRQIYERAATEIVLQGRAREREGAQAWAARGWNMPGGTAIRMQQLAATEINQMTAKKALEIATQEALQKDQQFQFATQQGLATEQLLEQAWQAMLGRGEQAYIAKTRAIADILTAYRSAQSQERITQFKAAADALVEQAKLVYAAESDAAKLQSEQETAQYQGATQIALKQADADTQAAIEGARIISAQDIARFQGAISINTERARVLSQMRIEGGRISSQEYVSWFERMLGRAIEQAKLDQTASLEGTRLTSAEAIETYRTVANAIIQDAQNQLNAAVEAARLQSQGEIATQRAHSEALVAGAQNLTNAAIEAMRGQVQYDTAHLNATTETRVAGAKNLTDVAIEMAKVQVQADTAGIGQEGQAAIAGARNLTDAAIASINARAQFDSAAVRVAGDLGTTTAQNKTQADIEELRAEVQHDVACLQAKNQAEIEGARNQTTMAAEELRAETTLAAQKMQSCTQASIATAGNMTQASIETARGTTAAEVARVQGMYDFYGRALGVEASAATALGNIYAQLASSMYNMYHVSWNGSQSSGISKSYGVSKGSSVSRSSGTSCSTSYSCEC